MSEKVRVALCGIRGKMGRELAAGLDAQPDIEVVGGCDRRIGPLTKYAVVEKHEISR